MEPQERGFAVNRQVAGLLLLARRHLGGIHRTTAPEVAVVGALALPGVFARSAALSAGPAGRRRGGSARGRRRRAVPAAERVRRAGEQRAGGRQHHMVGFHGPCSIALVRAGTLPASARDGRGHTTRLVGPGDHPDRWASGRCRVTPATEPRRRRRPTIRSRGGPPSGARGLPPSPGRARRRGAC